jgi:hypothetical protein
MSLKEILQKIVDSGDALTLSDSEKDWKASDLLNGLSERMLKTRAHHQQGMYIAEINEGGYLGRVMFKVKQSA